MDDKKEEGKFSIEVQKSEGGFKLNNLYLKTPRGREAPIKWEYVNYLLPVGGISLAHT